MMSRRNVSDVGNAHTHLSSQCQVLQQCISRSIASCVAKQAPFFVRNLNLINRLIYHCLGSRVACCFVFIDTRATAILTKLAISAWKIYLYRKHLFEFLFVAKSWMFLLLFYCWACMIGTFHSCHSYCSSQFFFPKSFKKCTRKMKNIVFSIYREGERALATLCVRQAYN